MRLESIGYENYKENLENKRQSLHHQDQSESIRVVDRDISSLSPAGDRPNRKGSHSNLAFPKT